MKIRFVFHKPQGERGVGKAIVVWTWVLGLFYNWKVLKYNYSHEELWLPDDDGSFITGHRDNYVRFRATKTYVHPMKYSYCGKCFSSTTRGTAEGVRFAPASEVLGKHPERWDYIEVEVDEARLEIAVEQARQLVGAKYDFAGIFGFLLPLPVQDGQRWYCSEICDWFKVLAGVYPKRYKRISPRRAACVLAKRWGEPKQLKK